MGFTSKRIDKHLELMKAAENVANREIEETEARIIMKNAYEVSGMKRMANAFEAQLKKAKETPRDGGKQEGYWQGYDRALRDVKEWRGDYIEGRELNIIDKNN